MTDLNSEGQRIFVAECWGKGCEDDPEDVRGFLRSLTSKIRVTTIFKDTLFVDIARQTS